MLYELLGSSDDTWAVLFLIWPSKVHLVQHKLGSLPGYIFKFRFKVCQYVISKFLSMNFSRVQNLSVNSLFFQKLWHYESKQKNYSTQITSDFDLCLKLYKSILKENESVISINNTQSNCHDGFAAYRVYLGCILWVLNDSVGHLGGCFAGCVHNISSWHFCFTQSLILFHCQVSDFDQIGFSFVFVWFGLLNW